MKENDLSKKFHSIGAAVAVLLAAVAGQPSIAETEGVQTSCGGTLPNGWTFATDALDGRFLHIIWTGTEGQTRVSMLTYYATNADGFPVFAGTLQDVVEVVLVDRSSGAPADGSEVMVFSEEWGWSSGTCRQLGGETLADARSSEALRQNLVGMRDTRATNWLQLNGFIRERVVELTSISKTERWRRDQDYHVDVIFYSGIVSEVSSVVE